MTGEEFKAIRKAMGLSNIQLKDMLEVSERTVTGQQKSGAIVDKRYELAIRALWFGVDNKPINLPGDSDE